MGASSGFNVMTQEPKAVLKATIQHFLLFTLKATLQLVFENGQSSGTASLWGGEKVAQVSIKEDSSILIPCTQDSGYQKSVFRLTEMQIESNSLARVEIF